jgi:hypothetical protein
MYSYEFEWMIIVVFELKIKKEDKISLMKNIFDQWYNWMSKYIISSLIST